MKKLSAALLLLLSACHNPTQPQYETNCETVYLPILVEGDTLWHKTSEKRCEWVDVKTGHGGVGEHP